MTSKRIRKKHGQLIYDSEGHELKQGYYVDLRSRNQETVYVEKPYPVKRDYGDLPLGPRNLGVIKGSLGKGISAWNIYRLKGSVNRLPLRPATLDDRFAFHRQELLRQMSAPNHPRITRMGVFAFTTLAGIALSALTFRATGNAVGSLTSDGSGLLGLLLFVMGITGMFIGIKK